MIYILLLIMNFSRMLITILLHNLVFLLRNIWNLDYNMRIIFLRYIMILLFILLLRIMVYNQARKLWFLKMLWLLKMMNFMLFILILLIRRLISNRLNSLNSNSCTNILYLWSWLTNYWLWCWLIFYISCCCCLWNTYWLILMLIIR